jgi:hypothetical protein
MPLARSDCKMDITRSARHFGSEVTQVARVRELTGGGYQVTMTGSELGLIKTALAEAERVARLGVEVLDGADQAGDEEPAENGRIREEIESLVMHEASLRWMQKAMSEIDSADKPAPAHHADIGQFRSGAALPVPRPRWRPGLWSL